MFDDRHADAIRQNSKDDQKRKLLELCTPKKAVTRVKGESLGMISYFIEAGDEIRIKPVCQSSPAFLFVVPQDVINIPLGGGVIGDFHGKELSSKAGNEFFVAQLPHVSAFHFQVSPLRFSDKIGILPRIWRQAVHDGQGDSSPLGGRKAEDCIDDGSGRAHAWRLTHGCPSSNPHFTASS